MPCVKLPTIPPLALPGIFASTPKIAASVSTPSATLKACCVFKLPSVGIAIEIPPLGVGAAVSLGILNAVIAQANAYIRQAEKLLSCPW